MNNYEWLHSEDDLKELSHKLCTTMDYLAMEKDNTSSGCELCPFVNYCGYASNGFYSWFMKEHKE